MFESFLDSNIELRVKPIASRVGRRANYRRERGVDQQLPTNDDERPLPPRVP
jgi:hypothetical protein